MIFDFLVQDRKLMKIGQYPSLADMALPKFQAYRKILGTNRAKELRLAIGLGAHGVGIGAFVYLRRIFEAVLEKHRRDFEK
jgi:hypothetical protein